MDDIGNIIYVLLVLASLLGGVWKNFTKEKADKKPVEPVETFESGNSPTHTFSREKRAEYKQRQQDKDDAAAERLVEMKEAAEKAAAERRLKKRNFLEEHDIIEDELEPLVSLKHFDAKKAIIYNEILNPPYL